MNEEHTNCSRFGLNGAALWRATWVSASGLVAAGLLCRAVFIGAVIAPWWAVPRVFVTCAVSLWCLGLLGPLFSRITVFETDSASLTVYIGPLWRRRVFHVPWGAIQSAGIVERKVLQWMSPGRWPAPPMETDVRQLAVEIDADSVRDLILYAATSKRGWVEGVEVTSEGSAAKLWVTQWTSGSHAALLGEFKKYIPDKLPEGAEKEEPNQRALRVFDVMLFTVSFAAAVVAVLNLFAP